MTLEADDQRERLPGEIETILFRIAQEAMSNVARYSQAFGYSAVARGELGQYDPCR